MTIKISALNTISTITGNVILPVVANISGTLTTVRSNVEQIGDYIIGTLDANLSSAIANISSMSSNIANLQVDVASLTANAATQSNAIDNLESNVATQDLALTNISSDILAINGNVSALEGNVLAVESDITGLEGRTSDLESNVTILQNDVITVQADLANVEANVATNTSDISDLQANAAAQAVLIDSLGGANLVALEANVSQLQVDMGIAQAEIGSMLTQFPSYGNLVVPSSPTDTGNKYDIVYDDDFVYICVETNTWIKVARVTW